MAQLPEADRYLLEQIRRGGQEAWSQLVDRYQGRLLAFARSKLPRSVSPEDLVQETFLSFLKGLNSYRGESSLETYLFTILRHKIIDQARGSSVSMCLIQDVLADRSRDDSPADAAQRLRSSEPTASWYARRDEARDRYRRALADVMGEVVDALKESLDFRDLRIIEMLFYCQLRNKDIAKVVGLDEKQVALIKHRCLREIAEKVGRILRRSDSVGDPAEFLGPDADTLLSDIWRTERLSCPKRSTIGAWLLGTLEPAWAEYVAFHVERLGCRYCQANLDDLRRQTSTDDALSMRRRILESTVGFLRPA